MKLSKPLLCFDLDDTLIADNYKFELTFCECIRIIITALETKSPEIDEILQTAREIDNYKWDTWPADKKFLPGRVAGSWVETYETLARKQKIPVKPHIKRLIWAQVMTNYDPPYYVMPSVIETLTELKNRQYSMNIITVGLENIQMRKLKLTQLYKFFENFYVVKSEKTTILSNLKEKHGAENLIMIGNSMRSDINPALSVGLRPIYIPGGSWHRFKADPINKNYTEVEKISDLLDILS